MPATDLPPSVRDYVASLPAEFDAIVPDRRAHLERIAGYLRERVSAGAPACLMFICTHNSRRSQLGQAWSAIAATYVGLPGFRSYSGGTEVTAFNRRALAALERAGVPVQRPATGDGAVSIRHAVDDAPVPYFSKRFDDPSNPARDFGAIMTCSSADAACPFVPGAELRETLPYEDPRVADGTDREAAAYDARCRQIAAELLYAFTRAAAGEARKDPR